MEEKVRFEVGDVVIHQSCFGSYSYTISKVTKTQAISCDVNGFPTKFAVEYIRTVNGDCFIQRLPRKSYRFESGSFKVIKKNK